MKAYHNTRDMRYKSPYGALPAGSAFTLRVRTDMPCTVFVRLWDGEEHICPMDSRGFEDGFLHEAHVAAPDGPCLLWYRFRIECEEGLFTYGAAPEQLGGEGFLYMGEDAPSFQITIYDAAYETPAWLQEGIMYQIFVDRFAMAGDLRSRRDDILRHESWYEMPYYHPEGRTQDNVANDFFGGNLRGILSKLPYLKSLGVTALYLNPIFTARSNHKYDTGNYHTIDPTFGDGEDFKALCEAAAENGMRVMLDGVFSHTGEDSVYFDRYGNYGGQGAYTNSESRYRHWYTFEEYPDTYSCWWGIPTLPQVNEMEPDYVDFIIEGEDAVSAHWLRAGASGWRLDVADELPMDFIRRLRARVKQENADAALIGEVWEDASHKVSYDVLRSYCLGDSLDAVMNYPLRDTLIRYLRGEMSARDAAEGLASLYENYPPPFANALMNLLGSHDRARIVNVLAHAEGDDLSKEEQREMKLSPKQRELGLARVLRMLLFTIVMPGIPCVYYGDEIGMEGAKDPFNRARYPWGQEDAQALEGYKRMLSWRAELAAIKGGDTRVFSAGEALCAFRKKGSAAVLAVIAPGEMEISLEAAELGACDFVDRQTGARYAASGGFIHLPVPACGYMLLRCDG